jgi:heme-degrading monooxygenase HmoA
VLLRLWRTEFDPERIEELNEFAKTRSVPMFDSFPGCAGHLFSHHDDTFMTISMWIGHHAIRQAEASDLYRETVDALEATGILRGEQHVEVFEVSALNLGWDSRRASDEAGE